MAIDGARQFQHLAERDQGREDLVDLGRQHDQPGAARTFARRAPARLGQRRACRLDRGPHVIAPLAHQTAPFGLGRVLLAMNLPQRGRIIGQAAPARPDRPARRGVGMDRPQDERERHGPEAAAEGQNRAHGGGAQIGVGDADRHQHIGGQQHAHGGGGIAEQARHAGAEAPHQHQQHGEDGAVLREKGQQAADGGEQREAAHRQRARPVRPADIGEAGPEADDRDPVQLRPVQQLAGQHRQRAGRGGARARRQADFPQIQRQGPIEPTAPIPRGPPLDQCVHAAHPASVTRPR